MDLIYKRDKTAADVDTLLEQHKNLVYYMLTQTGQLRNPDAESAAWEALWDAIGTFDVYSKTAFSTYACKIIKNAINDVLRKEMVRKQYEECSFDVFYAGQLSSGEREPIEEVVAAEEASTNRVVELFEKYIADKTGKTKDILLVWYRSEFTDTATNIAKICGCSTSYVTRQQGVFKAYLAYWLRRK